MTASLIPLIGGLARRVDARLPPDWAAQERGNFSIQDPDSIDELSRALGWPTPEEIRGKPKPEHFPLLAYSGRIGWSIADQWISERDIRVVTSEGAISVAWRDVDRLVRPSFPTIRAPETAKSALKIFAAALLGRRRLLAEATLATVVLNIITLCTSLYAMQVYDRVIPRNGFATLWVLTGGVAIALVIDFLIRTSRALIVDREAGEIDAEMSEFFFGRMQAVRIDARPPGIGTMAAQLRGLDQIRSAMTSASFFCLADLPFALFFIFIIGLIGGPIALIPLIAFPLALIAALIFTRLIKTATDEGQASSNRKNGILVEALDASETIKANMGGWHMLASWNRLVQDVHKHDQHVRRWSSIASATFSVLQQISYIGIIVAGVYLISAGELTQGALIACTMIGSRVNGPLVSALPNLIIQWGYARAALKALDALLAMPSDFKAQNEPIRLKLDTPDLRVEGITFKHRGAREGINIPSLDIPSGSRLGLIGPIGSGKSTLLRLLAGLYAPEQGHVLLNGVDVLQLVDEDLRMPCSYIAQDYRLIGGTLRDNLVLGLADPGDATIMEATNKTGLSHVIQSHPMGLALPISEGGIGLSGGQRALVGLTRALLAQPRVLLLDEPTANLDQESETKALTALRNSLPADGILILVTHKLQLLPTVDDVIIMRNGQIVHQGPRQTIFETLSAKRPQERKTSRISLHQVS